MLTSGEEPTAAISIRLMMVSGSRLLSAAMYTMTVHLAGDLPAVRTPAGPVDGSPAGAIRRGPTALTGAAASPVERIMLAATRAASRAASACANAPRARAACAGGGNPASATRIAPMAVMSRRAIVPPPYVLHHACPAVREGGADSVALNAISGRDARRSRGYATRRLPYGKAPGRAAPRIRSLPAGSPPSEVCRRPVRCARGGSRLEPNSHPQQSRSRPLAHDVNANAPPSATPGPGRAEVPEELGIRA